MMAMKFSFFQTFAVALLAALFSLPACGISAKTPKEKEAEAQTIRKMLDKRSFQIDVNYMIPQRGEAQSVSSFSLAVDGSSIVSQLPYAGQAWSVPYGGGKGLNFEGKIDSYEDKGSLKDGRTIVIGVKNDEDSYVYTLNVYDNGTVYIHVACRNRDSISYNGNIRFESPKE